MGILDRLNTTGPDKSMNPKLFKNSILGNISLDRIPQETKDVINLTDTDIQLQANKNIYSKSVDKFRKMTEPKRHYIQDTGTFKITDLKDGKAGIRHGGKINKQIVSDISTAAAKEGVNLDVALSTAMRETGFGQIRRYGDNVTYKEGQEYDPMFIMQAWNASREVKGIPISYDQFRLKHGHVDKTYVAKNNYGWFITAEETEGYKTEYVEKYSRYINEFVPDKSLDQPFRKEMRYLKKNIGRKYNPGEGDREKKLDYDLQVIQNNPDMYNYAKSIYDKALNR